VSAKLLLDQSLRAETLEFLRGLGLDVTSTRELAMGQATDDEIAEWAARNGRIVVTFNHHFGDVRQFPPGRSPGVIRLRI
jgi:predicted nuclease of predicted toxin-antitoxin system